MPEPIARVKREIKSYVRREGRMTSTQERALQEFWPELGIDFSPEQLLDLAALFGRDGEKVLEIGFGNGDSLLQMAVANPDTDYLGIEVHRPGVGHLLHRIHAAHINNIRVICHDAVEVLKYQLMDQSLDRVQLYFPDPWPKKKHHKRRILVQPGFLDLIKQKLKPGGQFHLATDWEDYAMQMRELLNQHPDFSNLAADAQFVTRPDWRPLTKFEQRGQRKGHGVWDLLYTRA